MRIDEFKDVFTAEIENGVVQKGDWGGFSGPIFTDSGGGIVFNLYTNPQEDVSVGIRHIPMGVPIMAASGWYMKELIKYPPQFKIGFMSNNPPVYDLLPKMQEMRKKTWSSRASAGRRLEMERMRRAVLDLPTAALACCAAVTRSRERRRASRPPVAKLCAAYSGLPDGRRQAGMVFIPGGSLPWARTGSGPRSASRHIVRLDGFWIDRHEVTNAQFQRFVAATGYVTLAERGPDPKRMPAPARTCSAPARRCSSRRQVRPAQHHAVVAVRKGANWREPEGPGSTIAGQENHPVVHVAYEDALAYARWLGRDLPTEAQWEFAARGGRIGEQDWMSAFEPDGTPIANTWQGVFPVYNSAEDGYAGTAPVGCFQPNGYGLYDMIGNVWEWTSDWYRAGPSQEAASIPCGPDLLDLRADAGQTPSKVIKGGSYLCASNYCARYRPTSRQPQEVDLSAGHVGFRTVLNAGTADLWR